MAVATASTLFRCKCAMKQSPALLLSRRNLMCFVPRLASIKSLELKPLRTINRSIGSSRQSMAPAAQLVDSNAQLQRPGYVAYDQSLANSINLIGNVGVNPNIQYQDSGDIVATSSLSVKKSPKGDPTWFFLEFQSDLAEIAAQHVRKGDRIHVAGRILVENVSVPDSEQKQTLVKVAVTALHFVDDVYGAPAAQASSAPAAQASSAPAAQASSAPAAQASSAPAAQASSGASSGVTTIQTPLKRAPGTSAEKRQAAEKLWNLFFENPTSWYDNRGNKRNPKSPDFKHKTTGDALWIDGYYVPTFVKEKIAELEDGGLLPKLQNISSSNTGTSTSTSTSSSSETEIKPMF